MPVWLKSSNYELNKCVYIQLSLYIEHRKEGTQASRLRMASQCAIEPQARRLRTRGTVDCKDSLFSDILPYTEDYYAYGDKHSKVIPRKHSNLSPVSIVRLFRRESACKDFSLLCLPAVVGNGYQPTGSRSLQDYVSGEWGLITYATSLKQSLPKAKFKASGSDVM